MTLPVAHADLPDAFERYLEGADASKRALLRADNCDLGVAELRETIA